MSLKHAILGLLTFHPMSGYTLKNDHFDESIANFWPADQAQIYRTLQSLEKDGLVTSTVVEGDTRPNQKQYTLTKAGQTALTDWLSTSHPPQPDRISFLVQLYFSRLVKKERLLEILNESRNHHQTKLEQYQNLEMPQVHTEEMKQQLKFGALTLEFGIRNEIMHIDWLNSIITQIENWE